MVCLHRIIIVFCLLFVFGISWTEPMSVSEGQSIEENAIQVANKEVEALRLKLTLWKPETGEKIKEEWQRMRLLRREHSAQNMPEHLDRQDRALAGKDFLPVRYVYQPVSAHSNVKHGEMWVFIERYTGNVLLVIPPGH